MARKVGAPKGGRVHWFILDLPDYVIKNYNIIYDYEYHNYFVVRKGKPHLYAKKVLVSDFYLVIRTSKRCFRVMAFNYKTCSFKYSSFKTSSAVGDFICQNALEWNDCKNWYLD